MGKIENIEQISLSLDVNSNAEKVDEEEFFLHDLLSIGLRVGRFIFFGISYSIKQSQISCSDFAVKNHRTQKLLLKCLHFGFFMFMVVPFFTERIHLSPCCLVNLMKKGLHIVRTISLLVAYYVFEIRGRNTTDGWVRIFKQTAVLQKKFRSAGLTFPSRSLMRKLGWLIITGGLTICVIRQYIFVMRYDRWYDRHSKLLASTVTLGFWKPDNVTTPQYVHIILGAIGILFEGVSVNFWHFCQIFHFFCVLTIWIVFYKLNNAWKVGYFKVNQLSQVVELHFQSIKLLNLLNQLISPLTFWCMAYNIACLCVWACYITVDFHLRAFHIAALCYSLKTLVEICLQADVNSKAHQISEWLEESCTMDEKFPVVDPGKFIIFTSQVYGKDCTGIRGLNYFVVTPHLCLTVIGIVVTYTVAVNQLCH